MRAWLTRRLATQLRREGQGERPDWRERSYRVLALRHDRIAEMILSTGVLRVIGETFPNLRLDVLASPLNAPVLRAEQYVREIVVFDPTARLRLPGALVALRRLRYDAILDLQSAPRSATTTLLMLASGAPYRFGVAAPGDAFAYTTAVPPRETQEHYVDRLAAILAVFGLQPAGLDVAPRIHLTAAERERGEQAWRGATEHRPAPGIRLLVNVSSSPFVDAWPDGRFVSLIRAARERTRTETIVIAARRERARAAVIAAESGARFIENDGIREAMAIAARAHLAFTPESSVGHACVALGVPAVVLHPRGRARTHGPYRSSGRAVESLTGPVADVSADDATHALTRLLAERDAATDAR